MARRTAETIRSISGTPVRVTFPSEEELVSEFQENTADDAEHARPYIQDLVWFWATICGYPMGRLEPIVKMPLNDIIRLVEAQQQRGDADVWPFGGGDDAGEGESEDGDWS